MSSLWTPGGERPVPRGDEPARSEPIGPPDEPYEPSEADMQARMEELRDQLARTPAEVVVANHAYGLFELAALHISIDPPQLDQARLAIDALGCLVEGLGGRLGEPLDDLTNALGQLRLAFVQVQAAHAAGGPAGGPPGPGPGPAGDASPEA